MEIAKIKGRNIHITEDEALYIMESEIDTLADIMLQKYKKYTNIEKEDLKQELYICALDCIRKVHGSSRQVTSGNITWIFYMMEHAINRSGHEFLKGYYIHDENSTDISNLMRLENFLYDNETDIEHFKNDNKLKEKFAEKHNLYLKYVDGAISCYEETLIEVDRYNENTVDKYVYIGESPTEQIVEQKCLRDNLLKIIDSFNDRARKIIIYKYGLDEPFSSSKTSKEICSILGISRTRMHQIIALTLRRMRNPNNIRKIIDYYREAYIPFDYDSEYYEKKREIGLTEKKEYNMKRRGVN